MANYDEIEIFSDGSCIGNPGPGGWAALVQFKKGKTIIREEMVSGYNAATTNNRMELQAATEGLKKTCDSRCKVTITVDSMYVKDGIEKWIKGWKRNGWKTSTKKPVMNKDLWVTLDQVISKINVTWKWTKGHATCEGNQRVDAEASRRAREVSSHMHSLDGIRKRKAEEMPQPIPKKSKTELEIEGMAKELAKSKVPNAEKIIWAELYLQENKIK